MAVEVVDPTEAAGFTGAAVAEVSTEVAVVEVSMVAVADSVVTAAEHIAEAAPTAARGLSVQEARTGAEALVGALVRDRQQVVTAQAEVHMADSIRRAA